MAKTYSVSLFIFRRDLRIYDNTALNKALECSEQVIPCFIFDPRQIEAHSYQSLPALQFMLQSIMDLRRQFNEIGAELLIWHGQPDRLIERAASRLDLRAVFINRDYTPFSRSRDEAIRTVCEMRNLDYFSLPDALLTEPEQVLKADQSPYQIFTAFYHRARTVPVRLPERLFSGQFMKPPTEFEAYDFEPLICEPKQPFEGGGRAEALAHLSGLESFGSYSETRDFPAVAAGTSRLSAHLKFGACSVREAYYRIQQNLGVEHPLLRQLYWRDFFTHLGYHFPRVFGHAFHEKYDALKWDDNQDLFQLWTEGRTGFPIVDAGMRELNATGFMHNRLRMITASFLVKDLHIDWRWGERCFARHLVDYDPCVNNGNWQWAASTGCDAQPYFRIFNPWRQQQKFDPDCLYVKRWIPELADIPASILHQWDKKYFQCGYPKPVVNHQIESERTKRAFKACG